MITHLKHIPPIIFALCILESCIMTTIVDEINETVAVKSSSNNYKEGIFSLQISNNANNTALYIDSIEICNITITNKATGEPQKGNTTIFKSTEETQLNFGDQICTPQTVLPEQKLTAWTPDTLPKNSNHMYITIHGQLYTNIVENTPLLLYSGKMYCSFTGSITPQKTTNFELTLYDNCPLYYQANGKMGKVLTSINFEVSVDDWEE